MYALSAVEGVLVFAVWQMILLGFVGLIWFTVAGMWQDWKNRQ